MKVKQLILLSVVAAAMISLPSGCGDYEGGTVTGASGDLGRRSKRGRWLHESQHLRHGGRCRAGDR